MFTLVKHTIKINMPQNFDISLWIFAASQTISFSDIQCDVPELKEITIRYGRREFFCNWGGWTLAML